MHIEPWAFVSLNEGEGGFLGDKFEFPNWSHLAVFKVSVRGSGNIE